MKKLVGKVGCAVRLCWVEMEWVGSVGRDDGVNRRRKVCVDVGVGCLLV